MIHATDRAHVLRRITLMPILPILALSFSLAIPAQAALAQQHGDGGNHHDHTSSYAGLETRDIKSLSEEDVEALRQGRGWGLALPAELNGVPGPAHLLEMKDEIGLTEDQVSAIEAIYEEMRAEAIEAGERIMAAEAALDAAFANGGLEEEQLRDLIEEAEAARAELRFVHLLRHLSTPPLLTADQIQRYSELRGYGSDACSENAGAHCH
jgi:Spy/CpxP family protein refolding chaperone